MSINRICNSCLKAIPHKQYRFIMSIYEGSLPLEKWDFCNRNCMFKYFTNWDFNMDALKESKKKILTKMRQ